MGSTKTVFDTLPRGYYIDTQLKIKIMQGLTKGEVSVADLPSLLPQHTVVYFEDAESPGVFHQPGRPGGKTADEIERLWEGKIFKTRIVLYEDPNHIRVDNLEKIENDL